MQPNELTREQTQPMILDKVLVADCDRKKNGANVHFVNSIIGRYSYAIQRKDWDYTRKCELSLRRFLATGRCYHPDSIKEEI